MSDPQRPVLWRPLAYLAAVLGLMYGRMPEGSRLLNWRAVALTCTFAAFAAVVVWLWQRAVGRRWHWPVEVVAVLGVFAALAFGFLQAVRFVTARV